MTLFGKRNHFYTSAPALLSVCLLMTGIACVQMTQAQSQQEAPQESKVPLPIKLPKPVFAGTAANLPLEVAAKIEKPTGKPRPVPLVPKGTINLALHKKVTSSVPPLNGSLDQITDGNKEANGDTVVELKPRVQWVQIDLSASCSLFYIAVWHYHSEPVVFHNVVVEVSNDPQFIDGVTILFNNDQENADGLGVGKDREYFETSEGKLIDAKGTKARYIRLYSKGSTYRDPLNRYTEVEAYRLPAK